MAEHLKVRPVVIPEGLHNAKDARVITKRWYTEQRGRVVGNTRAWDDLSLDEQDDLIDYVSDFLSTLRLAWRTR